MRRNNNKVITIGYGRHGIHINLGTILLFLSVLYIGVIIFNYFRTDKVNVYEVTTGQIDNRPVMNVTGIALRDEVVSYAQSSGYVNFFVQPGERVSITSTLYSIDESGAITSMLEEAAVDNQTLTKEDLRSISQVIAKYKSSYQDINYASVYQFQSKLNATILESMNVNTLSSINQSIVESGGQAFALNKSASSGIVEFYTDGYEGLKVEDISNSSFDLSAYSRNEISSGMLIDAGSPIYKTTNVEQWYIVFPMTADEYASYEGVESVNVSLVSEKIETKALFAKRQVDSDYYGILTLKRYMMQYAGDRFVQIRISTNSTQGLKIPKTAIVEKDYYSIPKKDYYVSGGNASGENGFNMFQAELNEFGFYPPESLIAMEDTCYVRTDCIPLNSVIKKNNSQETYTISATEKLKGVYCVNNGYAVFRYVNIIGEKGDYYIIDSKATGTVKMYDQIIMDSSFVEEGEVIAK